MSDIADCIRKDNGNQLVARVDAIEQPRNQMVKQRTDLAKLIEKPLLAACEILYDKNIRTYAASANKKDIADGAYIILDYDTLSAENRRIAGQHGEVLDYDGGKAVKIIFPTTKTTAVPEIREKSLEIARQFKTQEATWIPSYTAEHILLQVYGSPQNIPLDRKRAIRNLAKELGMFYDSKSEKFYYSREHFDKVAAHNTPKEV